MIQYKFVTKCAALHPDRWTSCRSLPAIWSSIIHLAGAKKQKGIKSLFILACWNICRERNNRVFKKRVSSVASIVAKIHDEAQEWTFADAKELRKLLFEPP
jgi:hypothetical protein